MHIAATQPQTVQPAASSAKLKKKGSGEFSTAIRKCSRSSTTVSQNLVSECCSERLFATGRGLSGWNTKLHKPGGVQFFSVFNRSLLAMASQRCDRLCRSAKSIKKTLGSRLKAALKSLGSVLVTGSPVGRRIDLASSKLTVIPLDSNPSPEAVSSGIELTPPLYKCAAANIRIGTLLIPSPDAYKALPFSRRCVFDINIRIQRQNNGTFGGKVAKRVLLDTGADLNLIAASAHEDVGSPIDLHPARLLSLGGRTFLEGKTELTFNFLGTGSLSTTKNTYTEVFAVVARNEQPLFDCILGAHWILRHWHDFTALMASKI